GTGPYSPTRTRHPAACRTKEGITMKRLLVLLLAGCVFTLSHSSRAVAGDEEETDGIPLSALAGTYSETAQGSYFFCFNNTPPFPAAKCGSAGSTGLPISALAVGVVTRDAKGNGCVTWSETDSDLPVDVSPPNVFVVHQIAKTKSYDPATGTGDGTFVNYFGGQCHGATLDTTGATAVSSGTFHFAVSEDGNRLDANVTSLTTPEDAIGDFSISATNRRLHPRRNTLLP